MTPHSTGWFYEDGRNLPAYPGEVNAAASSGAIQSPERGSVSSSLILESLQTMEEQPNLPLSLIVDAEERLRTQRLREAIIALGTACETASNQYLRRLGKENDTAVKRLLAQRVSFAEKRFHKVPEHLSGRSMKNEDPDTFDLIEKMYRARNSIVHESKAHFEDNGKTVIVDQRLATKFLEASKRAVEWLTEF